MFGGTGKGVYICKNSLGPRKKIWEGKIQWKFGWGGSKEQCGDKRVRADSRPERCHLARGPKVCLRPLAMVEDGPFGVIVLTHCVGSGIIRVTKVLVAEKNSKLP